MAIVDPAKLSVATYDVICSSCGVGCKLRAPPRGPEGWFTCPRCGRRSTCSRTPTPTDQ